MPAPRDLRALPKAHLHLHLEGGMRPATLEELAAADGVEVPAVRDFDGFTAFVGRYVEAAGLLDDEARLRRVVREVVEDAAAEGVVWIEPAFYAPPYRAVFGSDAATVGVVLDELAVSGGRLGVGTGLVIQADRTVDPAEAEGLARVAAGLAGRGVTGFGLANDEDGWPPEPFAGAFAVAREAGLMSVPHGGELAGAESVVGCLEACGAQRVMHGVRAVESPDLLARLAGEGVCLDVCPSSNLRLGVVSSLAEHPLPRLLDAGVRCSINADDPLMFGPGILDEYQLCRERFGLDDATLAAIATSSLECSAAPPELRAAARSTIADWLASSGGAPA